MTAEIVLASASPRRRELLDQIGIAHYVHPVGLDESMREGEGVIEHVNRLALEKAREGYRRVSQQDAQLVVLGADTVVEIDGESLGKPENAGQAAAFLARLSGKKHRVHTAVAVVTAGMVSQRLFGRSYFVAQLEKRGVDLRVGREVRILRSRTISEVISAAYLALEANHSVAEARRAILQTSNQDVFVVDQDQRLLGRASLFDLARAEEEGLAGKPVGEVATLP